MAALLILSDPITQVIYQRGEFDAHQSELVSEALFYFALSLPFAGVNLLLIRAFFSLQRPWVPTLLALANLFLNAGLDAVLYGPMGIGGVTLATAIVSLATMLVPRLRPATAPRRNRRPPDAGRGPADPGRVGTARGDAFGVKEALDGVVSDDFGGQLAVIIAAGAAGTAAYIAAVFALRVEEAHQLWALVKDQFGRAA